MFRVKICGITNPDDARAVADAGADAMGLNFYPGSSRYITIETGRTIVDALPPHVVKVGLFVNADVDTIVQTAADVALDLVQLPGDEPPELLAELSRRCSAPTIRAFRLGAEKLAPVSAYLDRCRALGALPRMTLLDAHCEGQYGGTGTVADWPVAAQYAAMRDVPPLVLAGGLTPENVARAITAVHPAAVDTAGGVESSPGRKDPQLVRSFVLAAQECW